MSRSEFEIIQHYFADSGLGFGREGITLGIGDDAALVEVPKGQSLVMSMDVLSESVHFPSGADPELVAYRALAVNLSDLAAMAAEPFCFTLGLTIPVADAEWLERFSHGLLALARKFNSPLVGGNLARGPLSIAIQVQGLVPVALETRRSAALAGDQIYVSGYLGDAAIALPVMGLHSHLGAAFSCLEGLPGKACADYFTTAYYKPQPRIALARQCAPFINAAIDISDGLAGDLGHLLRASKAGAIIHADALPVSEQARCCMSTENQLLAALYGGDDYELCVTVAPEHCAVAEAAAAVVGVRLTRIGEIVPGSILQCIDDKGTVREIDAAAFQHFHAQGA